MFVGSSRYWKNHKHIVSSESSSGSCIPRCSVGTECFKWQASAFHYMHKAAWFVVHTQCIGSLAGHGICTKRS